jgi:hypothetical protein
VIGLVGAQQGVGLALFGFQILDGHRGPKDRTVALQRIDVDDFKTNHARFDVADPGFQHALAFTGSVVTRVLAQVALFPGFLDGLNNGRALFLEVFQFLFQTLEAFD